MSEFNVTEFNDRLTKIEESQKALSRALFALSNTLKVVDAATYLALANIPTLELPSKDTPARVAPLINKTLKELNEKEESSSDK